MIRQDLKWHCEIVAYIIVCTGIVYFEIFPWIQNLEAAVAPNQQQGQCGPYYIWYQTGPDSYTHPTDYIDLYGITFDISDVVDDFDLVYFTDTPAFQRAALDKNRDGISDQYFYRINGNQLEWRPEHGRIRITQRGCWGSKFLPNCGYAMICIQPKPWFSSGRARIPIHVTKTCSPTGADCSETYLITHEYSNCQTSALPDFSIQKRSSTTSETYYKHTFQYTILIRNLGDKNNNTILTDTITAGTKGGTLILESLAIECPRDATCTIVQVTNDQLQLSLTNIPPNGTVTVSYTMGANTRNIPEGEMSYFTNTATLTNGDSVRVTDGVQGTGSGPSGEPERRPERPRR